ncbi:MAG: hypothetical protein RL662_659 [Bacteroidota bacterium]|jgi:uncharacterized metal-binding protein YceD (DUF177 family)
MLFEKKFLPLQAFFIILTNKVGKFSLYKIPLLNLTEGVHTYQYILDDQYFKSIGDADSDVKKGKVNVEVSVKRISSTFEFNFTLNGEVCVPCDRCLDDITVEANAKNRLFVKFGHEYSEESDEVVIIPEEEGELNIAWFLYEFVMLSIPMKRVHPPGKCNKIMSSKLNKHKTVNSDDNDDESDDNASLEMDSDTITDEPNDPRWDTLKGLVDEE